jgi:FKBP-type peptidyl-prolyl cis-trans isomerase
MMQMIVGRHKSIMSLKNNVRAICLFTFCLLQMVFSGMGCTGNKQDEDAAEIYRKENEDFLKENAAREGVKTLPSGLQYMVIKDGYGPSPELTEEVTVHYHGTLIDGTVFDSSVEKGKPLTFTVNQVIRGWQEALQLMPQGAKWRIFIPAHLAYGQRGTGSKIKPNAALIFEVELISING